LIELQKKEAADILVQGSVAIAAGIIFFGALFLPWLEAGGPAIAGIAYAKAQAQVAIPMTMILLATLTIFGGAIHIAKYKVGIQLATITSAIAFFISVMVIIVTLASASEKTLSLLIGPWIAAAGAIFGAISSKLERK